MPVHRHPRRPPLAPATALLCLAALAAGCVQMPPEELSPRASAPELASHVRFLAQPALKGRKPRTRGSRIARRYIAARFRAYGLKPWPGYDGYEQPFLTGTNLVGVLPGSDPALADQVVLLSAHYDHLGRDEDGAVLPGAADNASGVAVLLETAEQLALRDARPRRTVCFAAFDCEEMMLLGALSFAARQQFAPDRLAAVVNVDIVGRRLMDVLEETLFAAGTEGRPALRRAVEEAGRTAGLRVLPVGTDLVGPVGDHVALEPSGAPCLFFSSGWYGDYHQPTDTADRLDYDLAERAAKVVAETVARLADADEIPARAADDSAREELAAVRTVLAELTACAEAASLTGQEAAALAPLLSRADELLAEPAYGPEQRRRFIWELAEAVVPITIRLAEVEVPEPEQLPPDGAEVVTAEDLAVWAAVQHEFLATHRAMAVQEAMRVLRMLERHRPGLLRGLPAYERHAWALSERDLHLLDIGDGRRRLSVVMASLHVEIDPSPWPLLGPLGGKREASMIGLAGDCAGTPGELADYCLLRWRQRSEEDSYGRAWARVLRAVTGADAGESYEDWLARRLEQSGAPDERAWLAALVASPQPATARAAAEEALKAAGEDGSTAVRRLVVDTSADAGVRAAAVGAMGEGRSRADLLVLAALVADRTRLDREELYYWFDPACPAYEHPLLRFVRHATRKRWREGPTTMSELAAERLAELTGRDFGRDVERWWSWIERHAE